MRREESWQISNQRSLKRKERRRREGGREGGGEGDWEGVGGEKKNGTLELVLQFSARCFWPRYVCCIIRDLHLIDESTSPFCRPDDLCPSIERLIPVASCRFLNAVCTFRCCFSKYRCQIGCQNDKLATGLVAELTFVRQGQGQGQGGCAQGKLGRTSAMLWWIWHNMIQFSVILSFETTNLKNEVIFCTFHL